MAGRRACSGWAAVQAGCGANADSGRRVNPDTGCRANADTGCRVNADTGCREETNRLAFNRPTGGRSMKLWDIKRENGREKGVLLPVFSLPSGYGIGCFSKEAREFIDWLHDTGHTYWQILPLNPT